MGPDEQAEQQNLKLAVDGNQEAREWCAGHFARQVAGYAEIAFGTCPGFSRAQLSVRMAPEDLVQEVWYIVCSKGWPIVARKDGRLAPVFVAYLRSTVGNVFWKVVRAAIRSSREALPTSLQNGVPDDTRSVMSKAAADEEQLRIRALVDGRDPVDRELLHGWMWGVPYAELAARLGMEVDAARQRLHRAVAKLRLLEHQEPELEGPAGEEGAA